MLFIDTGAWWGHLHQEILWYNRYTFNHASRNTSPADTVLKALNPIQWQNTHHAIRLQKSFYHYNIASSSPRVAVAKPCQKSWWRHQMEMFFAFLAIWVGNSPATDGFPSKRPAKPNFDVFFDLLLNGWVNDRDVGDLRGHRAQYDVTMRSRAWLFYCPGALFRTCHFEYSNSIELMFFCRNMHLDLILIVFTTKACCSISSGVEFIRGPPGISLYCIDIGDFTPRSVIECALRTSQMDLYGNSFAYRNGKCYVCRADSENCNVSEDEYTWASCQIRKIAGAHAPGMPGTFSPSPQVSDPDMHHGTCVTHVPWCMPGSLTSGFIWNRRRGETFPAFPAHAQPAILRIW